MAKFGHMKMNSVEDRQADGLVNSESLDPAPPSQGLSETKTVQRLKWFDDAEATITPVEVESWEQEVNGELLLTEVADLLRRFVVLPKRAEDALALWVLHTYAFAVRDVTAYIGIESPDKRCGKTTLLTLLSELVNRPVVASNISSSAFFRVITEVRPTLLVDEADTGPARER